ncbi:MAG TPA: hypothetical protein DDY70_04830 [Clostridiales bacterium]|nr:hypothetical protein [Clostridiales bacterium]
MSELSRSCGHAALPVTRRRTKITAIAFLIFAAYLVTNIFRLQYFRHEYYKDKVYDQITTSSAMRAKRGNIYDANMNLLATTRTVWRVFLSSRDIKKTEKADGVDYGEKIADGLSSLLGVDKENLLSKIRNTNVLDITVKRSVEEEEYRAVLGFIEEAGLEKLVFTEAQTSRYYPSGTMAAHVLGFTGSDNQGLYGLEYRYDETLAGKDGYYVYAKDANGQALPTEYATYFPAEDGYSLVTTLDSYIQGALEGELEKIRINHQVNNRVTGIVMDTTTGAILAMATSSPFDPNDPYTLDSVSEAKLAASGLSPGSDEYRAYKRELMQVMWSNKAVSETYEPGSTFKIVTVATALERGVATMSDRFSCIGYYEVGGWHIKCHKVKGHGSGFTLAYGLQMSCNPTMMQLAERIGAQGFYDSVGRFGYFEKTGIDLPSEASTIFHKPENIGSTELATASFGQRFKVTVIGQLTAIAAVANGGNLVTPYVVEKVIDSEGNTVTKHENTVRRRVISEEVARTVSAVLEEGVSGDGGAKNARVPGYKIAAKTGTSQKFDVLDANGNSYLRIGSTVAFAPSDGSGIAVIIVVDEPTTAVKYGSVVAAPYVAEVMAKALPYLGYERAGEEDEITVENFVGMHVDTAKKKLTDAGIAFEVVGNGSTVLRQTPGGGERVTTSLSRVILYTEESLPEDIVVPDLVGKSAAEANRIAIDAGFNICIRGVKDFLSVEGAKVAMQSLPPGSVAKRGDVILLTLLYYDSED